jgi:hypothetical protein
MNRVTLQVRALTICSAVALCAGCYGVQPPTEASSAVPWMRAEAKSTNLLYVVYPTTNTQGDVALYSYPQGTLEGEITGIEDPGGDCSDAKGDVYVINDEYGANTIVEFAHGDTKPIRTLKLRGEYAYACAVDPTTGDLAVTDYGSATGPAGDVAVYRHAQGKPHVYTDPSFINYAYCTYDDSGNLFVDGKYPGGYEVPIFAELPRSSGVLATLTLDKQIGWIGGIQWDGKHLAVEQADRPYIFRFDLKGTKGTLVGSTPLSAATLAFQFILVGNKALVANTWFYDRYEFETDILLFDYPKGGGSVGRIAYRIGGDELISVAYSPHG